MIGKTQTEDDIKLHHGVFHLTRKKLNNNR